MTTHHNPKDKTLLHQPDIAVLHIQRAKAAKFNRATLAPQKIWTGSSRDIGTIVAARVLHAAVNTGKPVWPLIEP